jgi:hypothetical protein
MSATTYPAASPAASSPADASNALASIFVRPPDEEAAREGVCARLARMERLPPGHEALSLSLLLSIESLYDKLLTLHGDDAREQFILDTFPDEQDLRTAMLALIDLLDPTIETSRATIRDCDIDSLIAVVLFEERLRLERSSAARSSAAEPVPPASTTMPAAMRKMSPPPESGARIVAVPPPKPKPASQKG